MTITGVKRHELPAVLPRIREYFDSFAKRAKGEVSAEELILSVVQGRRQCWLALDGSEIKACALTRIEVNPKRTLVLDYCAGRDRHGWRDDLVAELRAWAESLGSGRFRIVCRPGWERELKPLGFRRTHVVMEIDLGQE